MCTWVRLPHSHLPKWTAPRGTTNSYAIQPNKWGRCESRLKCTRVEFQSISSEPTNTRAASGLFFNLNGAEPCLEPVKTSILFISRQNGCRTHIEPMGFQFSHQSLSLPKMYFFQNVKLKSTLDGDILKQLCASSIATTVWMRLCRRCTVFPPCSVVIGHQLWVRPSCTTLVPSFTKASWGKMGTNDLNVYVWSIFTALCSLFIYIYTNVKRSRGPTALSSNSR